MIGANTFQLNNSNIKRGLLCPLFFRLLHYFPQNVRLCVSFVPIDMKKLLQKLGNLCTRRRALMIAGGYIVFFLATFSLYYFLSNNYPQFVAGGESNQIKYDYKIKAQKAPEAGADDFHAIVMDDADTCGQNAPLGIPDASRRDDTSNLYCFNKYLSVYSEGAKMPLIVAYSLDKNNWVGRKPLQVGNVGFQRFKNFTPDAASFNGTPYVLKQLAPLDNFLYDKTAVGESLYMTNVVPMNPVLANGVWQQADYFVRKMFAEQNEVKNLYVLAGPLYLSGRTDDNGKRIPNNLGQLANGVVVPTHYYKVILEPRGGAYSAFIFPNTAMATGNFKNYQVELASIEKETKLKLFPNLDAKQRRRLEDLTEYLK